MVKAAVGNEGICGFEILKVLFEHQGSLESLPISEEVAKAAAGNS